MNISSLYITLIVVIDIPISTFKKKKNCFGGKTKETNRKYFNKNRIHYIYLHYIIVFFLSCINRASKVFQIRETGTILQDLRKLFFFGKIMFRRKAHDLLAFEYLFLIIIK